MKDTIQVRSPTNKQWAKENQTFKSLQSLVKNQVLKKNSEFRMG
ncbi:MAG: hypothetical protein RMY62_015840 [Nostoc sp. ZfuVER08]|nr:hypothetical protein [Nostoc punctiforme]MDZ8010258.1 hypothetical protein [Nostoc sp. ZfuVER08]